MTDLVQKPDNRWVEEAEKALLGGVLINPGHLLAIDLEPADFYLRRHGQLWQVLRDMQQRGTTIEYLSLVTELDQRGCLDQVGGAAYLTQLIAETPNSTLTEVYSELVKRAAGRRELLRLADTIRQLSTDSAASLDTVIARIQVQFEAVQSRIFSSVIPIADAVQQHMDTVEAVQAGGERSIIVPTGFRALDDFFDGGMTRGKYVVVGGRPHTGKTAWMLSMALRAARAGIGVAFFAIADGDVHEITTKLISMISRLPAHRFRSPLTDAEYRLYVQAANELTKLPIIVDDTKFLSPQQIYQRILAARRLIPVPLTVACVDYFQRINPGPYHQETARQYFARISAILPNVARRSGVCLYVASQLSRAAVDQRPALETLKETGNLEEDADVVLFPYRAPGQTNTEFIVAKNRINGRLGSVFLEFDPKTAQFTDTRI